MDRPLLQAPGQNRQPCPAGRGACTPGLSGPSLHPQLLCFCPGPPSHRGLVRRTPAPASSPHPKTLSSVTFEKPPLPYNTTSLRFWGIGMRAYLGTIILLTTCGLPQRGRAPDLGSGWSKQGGGGPQALPGLQPRSQATGHLGGLNQLPLAPPETPMVQKHRLWSETRVVLGTL